jgi:hypothetical protein
MLILKPLAQIYLNFCKVNRKEINIDSMNEILTTLKALQLNNEADVANFFNDIQRNCKEKPPFGVDETLRELLPFCNELLGSDPMMLFLDVLTYYLKSNIVTHGKLSIKIKVSQLYKIYRLKIAQI